MYNNNISSVISQVGSEEDKMYGNFISTFVGQIGYFSIDARLEGNVIEEGLQEKYINQITR